jgi:hypothetical protein
MMPDLSTELRRSGMKKKASGLLRKSYRIWYTKKEIEIAVCMIRATTLPQNQKTKLECTVRARCRLDCREINFQVLDNFERIRNKL